jgi:hypothetical protein
MKTNLLTTCLLAILSCSGCFYVPAPEIPEIRLSAAEAKNDPGASPVSKETAQAKRPVAEEKTCEVVAMPESIPKNIELVVVNGKVVKADKGGETLIRQYAATRKAIKAQWDALSPSP